MPSGDNSIFVGWRFRFFVGALLLALILPRIVQRGMFLDGVTYAVVARNLAIGVGSIWQPSFGATTYRTFYEQLPLGMGLEAIAFAIFGDHLGVERVFSVAVFALHAGVIVAIWRSLLPAAFDWLPLLFWVLPSTVTWVVINNMLENTQALFTSAAVLCLLRGHVRATGAERIAWAAAAGASVVAAALVKGPVGLFPLAVPAALPLLRRRATLSSIVALWTGMGATVGLAVLALFASDASRHAISEFARSHLEPALRGERGLPRKSADIARHLTLGIWGRMAALLAVIWMARRRMSKVDGATDAGLFFLVVGLIASLPLLFSPVLAGHYLVPAIPFFALSAAAFGVPLLASARGPVSAAVQRAPVMIAILLIVASAGILAVRGPMERRDVSMLQDLDALAPAIPRGATIGTCESAAEEWGAQSYLQRFFRASLDPRGMPVDGWFLVVNGGCAAPSGCEPRAGGERLRLFHCRGTGSGVQEFNRFRVQGS